MTKLLDLVSDFATGVNKGLTTDLVGAPVDIINMGLKAVGVPTSKYPVGGSDWIKQKMGIRNSAAADPNNPKDINNPSTAETVGSLSTMFLNPAMAIAGLGKAIAASKSIGVIAAPGIIGSAKRLLSGEDLAVVMQRAKYVDDEIPAVALYGNRKMYEDTGAYVGLDGNLKSVISDAKAAINPNMLKGNQFNKPGDSFNITAPMSSRDRSNIGLHSDMMLPDFLDHPELFKAYPELKGVNVVPGGGYKGGYYNAATKQMGIGTFPQTDAGINEMLQVVLHEANHGIQKIEGFTAGGNTAMFRPADFDKRVTGVQDDLKAFGAELKANYPNASMPTNTNQPFDPYKFIADNNVKPEHFEPLFEYKKAMDESVKLNQINFDSYKSYKNLGGEAESRATEAMYRKGDFTGFPLDHYDVPLDAVTPSPLDSIISALQGK